MQTTTFIEPILRENPDRHKPVIVHHDLNTFYKKHQASFWTAEEIDLASDIKDWDNLSLNEQKYIRHVLAFFAISDGIVGENLVETFSQEVQYVAARYFYGFQIMMENVHAETYRNLIETFIRDSKEREEAFDSVNRYPAIGNKARWAMKWMDPKTASFAKRLVAFSLVEGVFFSGSFCAIYWLKKRGKMPGLCFSNFLIAKDEALHTDFACWIYRKHIVNKIPEEEVIEMVKEAVEIEIEFVCESLPVNLIGMNAELMGQYVKFVADRHMQTLGYSPIFNVQNPFDWMELISMQSKENFFEKRVGDYQVADVAIYGDGEGENNEQIDDESADDDF